MRFDLDGVRVLRQTKFGQQLAAERRPIDFWIGRRVGIGFSGTIQFGQAVQLERRVARSKRTTNWQTLCLW